MEDRLPVCSHPYNPRCINCVEQSEMFIQISQIDKPEPLTDILDIFGD
jgi:hypothetical protein